MTLPSSRLPGSNVRRIEDDRKRREQNRGPVSVMPTRHYPLEARIGRMIAAGTQVMVGDDFPLVGGYSYHSGRCDGRGGISARCWHLEDRMAEPILKMGTKDLEAWLEGRGF